MESQGGEEGETCSNSGAWPDTAAQVSHGAPVFNNREFQRRNLYGFLFKKKSCSVQPEMIRQFEYAL
jgi:uncharacterized protein YdhG (YjbR/CyaY superfamily)